MSPNPNGQECINHNKQLQYNNSHNSYSSNKDTNSGKDGIEEPLPSNTNNCNNRRKSGFGKAMKILSLILILVILFRETRHQFLSPSFSLLLATEEFIEPEIPTTEAPPVSKSNLDTAEKTAEELKSSIDDALRLHQQTNDGAKPTLPKTVAGGDTKSEAKVIPAPSGDHSSSGVPQNFPIDGTLRQDKGEAFVDNSGVKPLTQDDKSSVTVASPEVLSMHSQDSTKMDGEPEGNASNIEEVKIEKSREQEEPIPSYMEWAQKKQLELMITHSAGQNGQPGSPPSNNGNGHQTSQGQQNGNRNSSGLSSSGTQIDANLKNFASPDCGAKVVQSNSGSTNPSGVLSSSHDEYMLNKCGVPVWFVVELCEPLTIEKVSLGNLELFSSSPKEFELGISDRYPTRDWVKLGPFPLPDARAIHPIALPSTNSSTFGKFLKVSILSHHGSEHYCPLSVIRVNGKSEYEVLESETTHQEDTDNEENGLHEEQLDDLPRNKPSEKSVVGRAKDAVLNIVNAVKAFSGSSSVSVTSELDQIYLKSKCYSVIQCLPSSWMKDEIHALLSCNSSKLLPFLSRHSPWCGWDYCHAIFSRNSIGLPWQPEGFFASLFGGPSVLHALCNFNKPLKDGCDPILTGNSSFLEPSSSISDGTSDSYINDSLNAVNSPPSSVDLKQDEASQTQTAPDLPQHESEPQTVPSKSVSEPGYTEPSQEQQIEAPQIPSSSGFIIPETQIPASNNVDEASQYIHQQAQGAGSPQQKESVFVRLSNRIKTLERNQSLTASYLEELSRRFKKQNEDNSILNELNKKMQNDTRGRLLQVDEYYRQELQSLRRNIDDVRERLFTVQLQRSLLVIVCFSQTLLIVGGWIWVKRRLRDLDMKCQTDALPIGKESSGEIQKVFNTESEFNRYIVGRKRSNSDVTPRSITEKTKKIKKKKRNAAETRALQLPLVKSEKIDEGYNFSGSLSKPNENIDPRQSVPMSNINAGNVYRPPSASTSSNIPSSLTSSSSLGQRPTSLLTKVDSPFTLIHTSVSSSAGSYLNSSVSASGRFALLASPGPEPPGRIVSSNKESVGGVQRSGSGSSVSSSSNSTGDRQGTKVILNGHAAVVASAKKGKKVGLKAFMPKIFDR